MRLYKRGYSLITRSNVDFRFDKTKQELLGILPDNDGVAYIFLRNKQDSSFEVGRFEILGSMRLRTMKYKVPPGQAYPMQGKIGVAPRGHAYIAFIGGPTGNELASFIDLDFYQSAVKDQPLVVSIGELDQINPLRANIERLLTLPEADRNIVVIQREVAPNPEGASGLGSTTMHAFDLNRELAWNTAIERHQHETSEARGSISFEPRPDGLDLLMVDRDTLVYQSHSLASGKADVANRAALSLLDRSMSFNAALALRIGKHLFLVQGRQLYRLSLP
jgi:hypothetical protein